MSSKGGRTAQERGVSPQSLVVQLTFNNRKSFLGWTGLPATTNSMTSTFSRGTTDKVELDPQFAQLISIPEASVVQIELLRDMPVASQVSVTPLTPDDWDILELNAEFVESNLLSQVRAVADGMQVGCWVGKNLVRFSVDSCDPSSKPAVLLTSATELHVAPRTRTKARDPEEAHELSGAAIGEASRGCSGLWESIRKKPLRTLPFLHLVRAKDSDDSGQSSAYIHPMTFRAIQSAVPSTKVGLSKLSRPTAKSDQQSSVPATEGSETESTQPTRATVTLCPDRAVPIGHIWIAESVRSQLDIVDGRFELLRLHDNTGTDSKAAVKSPTLVSRDSNSTKLHASSSTASNSKGSEVLPPLAGVEQKLATLRDHVRNSLFARKLGRTQSAVGGLLVTGASGSGKTALVRQAAFDMSTDSAVLTHVIHVDAAKVSDERPTSAKQKIKDWFDEASWYAPSMLVIDNIDRMVAAEVEHADSFASLHLAHTFLGLASSALSAHPIALLVTAQSNVSLHPLLLSTHLLAETISLRAPDKMARRDILANIVSAKTQQAQLKTEHLNYAGIASNTEGYLPADLRDLVDRAIHLAAKRSFASRLESIELTGDDFSGAQAEFVPLSLRDVKLQKSEVQWSDIGGLQETRKILRETLEWPTKYGPIFASCPLRLRSGLLLYGFPGCGKTLLASAVAKECGLNFISIKGPEILNKYIGASEQSVRELFERAQAAKPCILFFDEFDSIAPKRGHDSTGVTDRVVNQMLTQMDGAEGLDGVYVLAATSRPDLIDPALLRPGRLDKSLLCDMPDRQDRLEIMTACARKIELHHSVDLADYADRTAGFSGADLQAFIYNAHLDAVHSNMPSSALTNGDSHGSDEQEDQLDFVTFGATGQDKSKTLSRAEQAVVEKRLELIRNSLASGPTQARGDDNAAKTNGVTTSKTLVNRSHLDKSLETTRPSVPKEELARLRRIYHDFVAGRSANGLPSGEASDEIGGRSSLM